MTRGGLLGRDPSGKRSALAWTVRKVWNARFRCLLHTVLKQSPDMVASPGTVLAPALATDREQQQQHILTPKSAKAAPAQRHAHYCSAHSHTCAHTYKHRRMCEYTQARIHTRVHTYTRTNTQAHTHTHTYARIHPRTHTHTHTHTHTCICTHMLRA